MRAWPPCRPGRGFYAGATFNTDLEHDMGKYFLAWLLGVPGILLVLLWLFFH
jgi:hypothetical protein